MSPTPQEGLQEEVPKKLRPAGEEVVISGMSGIFPMSDSVEEFSKNLYNKVDMVTSEDPRWVYGHAEVPKHLGKVNGMGKFDSQFFRVHHKQAATMEPMSRKLLEHAYSAIYDSGINPLQLRGQNVGVFMGSCFSESEKTVIYERVQRDGFGITGCNKAMYANRISYWIDGKGPSYTLDVACSSSTACLEHAYRSITSGQCDAAIVGGCNLCMHPSVSMNFKRAGFLSLDGKTRCFDKNAEGYVRSDAISVMFLQKAKDAKRIYSEVFHAKCNYSPRSDYLLPVRDPKELQEFFEEFYSEIGVSPNEVEYIEANGAAFKEADSNELAAIGRVFAKEKPISIGCVKSNMGSSEPASGLCGLTKVCLAFHHGIIPGNLHFDDTLEVPELKENKIKVLTETTKFKRGFAALNSFSYSGTNVHVLLKGRYKEKNDTRYNSSIPYLVPISSRQDNHIHSIIDSLKASPIDPEQIGLLHNIHKYDIPGHMSRGYMILDTNAANETVCLSQNIQYCPGTTPPVWFVYSGMGSQWATMGAELMRIPIFAAAIQKCDKVLSPKGIDIVRLLTDPDKTIYDNILHSFVGIAAVQIGLTDILTEMGIVPDNIIGHSVGELGCAYADGCFTAEEMILSAYSRGLVSVQTPFIRGSMAAVGLGYKNIIPLCPSGIEVACHNSADSATISGPADIMKQFVAELTARGIFAKEVPCSNIAYHSKYIAGAGPALLQYLNEVIKTPNLRSKKWLSTSVPMEEWNEPIAKYSSAEYHTNNLLNPVLFEETSKRIPSNALVIEVAPHGLLQAILKRSLSECQHVPLTKRGTADPVKFFLDAVGKLYQAGLNPKVDVLYPKIEYPVSTETPMLSHLVGWEHSENWAQAQYNNMDRIETMIRDTVISIHDDDYSYLKGHSINGKNILPESLFLQLVWENLAMYHKVNYRDMSVMFQDVHFHNQAVFTDDKLLKLNIMILKGNNQFEVTYEDSTIVSGIITKFQQCDHVDRQRQLGKLDDLDGVTLSRDDIYTILHLKGYNYKGDFQSLQSLNSNCTKANIKWTNDWVTLFDSMFQLNAFARDYEGISTPTTIKKLIIDVEKHKEFKNVIDKDSSYITAELYSLYEHTKCGGVTLDGLEFKDTPVVEEKENILLAQEFVPHFITSLVELKTALQTNLQIVADNTTNPNVKVVDLTSKQLKIVSEQVQNTASEIPIIKYNKAFVDDIMDFDNITVTVAKSDLLIIDDLLENEEKLKKIHKVIPSNTFVMALEHDMTKIVPKYKLFNIITAMSVQKQIVVLLKKVDNSMDPNVTYMPITLDQKFLWISKMQAELAKSRSVILVSERQPYCGLLGMVKKLREEYGNKIGLVIIEDNDVPTFNPEIAVFRNQVQKQLAFNIFKKGQWGGYYYVCDKILNKTQNIQLRTTRTGDMESLSWVEQPSIASSNMQVQVCFAGPSFKDVLNASSNTNNHGNVYGMDFSGINNRGEKVMGLISGGAISNTVEADPDFLWPVPEYWTLEDAATVPLPYILAYYCFNKCNITNGTNIFVHGGCGAFGQAVITVCHSLGFTVFTTVSDDRKKEFLMKLHPTLKDENISYSTDSSFRDKVCNNARSGNSLCSVVINCHSGDMRKATMKCSGFTGIFLDLSDHDMLKNEDFGMSYLMDSRRYIVVKLSSIFRPEYAEEKKQLQLTLAEGIAKGVVKPLSRVVYSPVDVCNAFKLISSRKHRGKVLIKMNSNLGNSSEELKVSARMSHSSKGTYIIVCEDDIVLGIELAERLVKRGARKLVIRMKSNVLTGYCDTKILSWTKSNVTVKVSTDNLQTEKGCANLLKDGAKLGPILGIFIVQNFSGAENLEPEDVAAKFNNTAGVVAILDQTSRNVCNELEHFVVLNHSSGTVSDEYMVSATDSICKSRRETGLPALSFRDGLLKEVDEINPERSRSSISAVLNALETSLNSKYSSAITYELKENTLSKFLKGASNILGLKDINIIDENILIKNLLVNDDAIDRIKSLIQEVYQINYSVKFIQEMKISSLKNLESTLSLKPSAKEGFETFFTHIDSDECTAAEPLITMGTACNRIKKEDELDPKATYLMLLPGFDDYSEVFSTICERLKVQAVAFQYGPELTNASVADMAANVLKFMKKRFQSDDKFYILGYSFGVDVALEVAALYEKEGKVGTVYCLDSSPDAVRAQFKAHVGDLTETELQNNLVQHMYKLMGGQNSEDIMQKLQKVETWEDKIELYINMLRGVVNLSNQYKRFILEGAYKKIMLAREYEPTYKLQSELVLIKGKPHPNLEDQEYDYGLSKYTTKPVKVFDIDSDHASAPSDCRVPSIVNKFLGQNLLEAFKNKNLCWSYLNYPFKSW